MAIRIRRREFIVAISGVAAAGPLAARAQQPAMPVIGILGSGSAQFKDALAQGLKETGYVEGQNVRIEYRWANGAYERLPGMASELVGLHVNIIGALGTLAAKVAKETTDKVSPELPVVFAFGADPVAEGLVASLSRPGGNVTGSTSIGASLAPKRLELLRTFLGNSIAIAILINPDSPASRAERKDAESASRAIEQRLEVLTARNEHEIDAVFAGLKEQHIGALIISVDTFYYSQIRRMAALASGHAVPAIGPLREFASAGGLISYSPSIWDVVRLAGVYIGKVLKGVRPADLPVMQPTKFELTVNLKAAKVLGIEVPASLLAIADEVIE
jgi:putative tryptophan/tyrosine transport system substrate-binding protein